MLARAGGATSVVLPTPPVGVLAVLAAAMPALAAPPTRLAAPPTPLAAPPVPLAAGQATAPRPLIEGPPDSDVVLEGHERALERLVAGDLAWREGRREAAFDAWRDALEESGDLAAEEAWRGGTVVAPPPFPGADPDGTLARRAEDALYAVRRRLAALAEAERDAWRARFEPLAELERAAAGATPRALARVQRAFPATRAAARAALALADLAAERGEQDSAAVWAARAADDAAPGDAALRVALAARARPRPLDSARLLPGAGGLHFARAIDLGPPLDERDAPIPGLAWLADDPSEPASPISTWFHGLGRLVRLDAEGRATAAVDVASGLRALGVESGPAFSEPAAPWDERFAARGSTLILVAGRAREARGNALVGVEARGAPRLVWARDSAGRVVEGLRADGPPLCGVEAHLEFQPGPLLVGDVLFVHVRATPRAGEAGRSLDEARVESWCAGLDPRDGALLWSRRLATGATLRGLDRGRITPPEPTSLPALAPLALEGGRVALDTGLGALALVEALDGRLNWCVRLARRGSTPAPAGGLTADARRLLAAPAAEGAALLVLHPGPDTAGVGLLAALPLVGLEPRLALDAREGSWTSLAGGLRGVRLVTEDLATGVQARSAELPWTRLERGAVDVAHLAEGWLAAGGGRIWVLDRELRLRADLDIGSRAAFARTSVVARRDARGGELACVAGPNRIVFLESR